MKKDEGIENHPVPQCASKSKGMWIVVKFCKGSLAESFFVDMGEVACASAGLTQAEIRGMKVSEFRSVSSLELIDNYSQQLFGEMEKWGKKQYLRCRTTSPWRSNRKGCFQCVVIQSLIHFAGDNEPEFALGHIVASKQLLLKDVELINENLNCTFNLSEGNDHSTREFQGQIIKQIVDDSKVNLPEISFSGNRYKD